MSSPWTSAERVSATALTPLRAAGFAPWGNLAGDGALPAVLPNDPYEQGFEAGLVAGREAALAELAGVQARLASLAHQLETLQAEPPAMLAEVLATVVGRLVEQVVGDTPVSPDAIRARAEAVARIVTDQAGPSRFRVHPDDLPFVQDICHTFELVPDPAILPGSIVCETAAGWIEHGPEAGMERLRQALDQMTVAR